MKARRFPFSTMAVLTLTFLPLPLSAQDQVRRRVVIPADAQPAVTQPSVAQPNVAQPNVPQPAIPPAGGSAAAATPPVAVPRAAQSLAAQAPVAPATAALPAASPVQGGAAPRGPALEEDIRPARPPVEIPKPPESNAFWIWLCAGLAVVGVTLWLLLRRRSPKYQAIAAMDRAMHALQAVDRQRNTVEAGPLADGAAGAVRQFIAERFGIAAPQRTTEEFLHTLAAAGNATLGRHREMLADFLKACDMAKFAGADFDAAERRELLERAFTFVRAAGNAPLAPPPPPHPAPQVSAIAPQTPPPIPTAPADPPEPPRNYTVT